MSNGDHKPLSPSQVQAVIISLKGKLNIGSVSSANDCSLSRVFYSLTNTQYEQVKEIYQNGLIMGDDCNKTIVMK